MTPRPLWCQVPNKSIWHKLLVEPCAMFSTLSYLLYIRMSGFQSAEGGILTSSTFPYSLVFQAKFTSSHSWEGKRRVWTKFNWDKFVMLYSPDLTRHWLWEFVLFHSEKKGTGEKCEKLFDWEQCWLHGWYVEIKIYCRACLPSYCSNTVPISIQATSTFNIVSISTILNQSILIPSGSNRSLGCWLGK